MHSPDSSLFEINGAGDPDINLSNVTLFYLYAAENSNMNVSDSAVNISVETHLYSANFSASGLHPVYVNYWNPYHNHSISVASQGWVPNLTLIDTDVKGWKFVFFGSSNVTILDSELFGLVGDDSSVVTLSDSVISVSILSYGSSRFNLYDTATDRLGVSHSATASLVNSTCEVYQIYDQSEVRLSWYLDTSVFDSIGQDVPSANVTASFPNATVAESKLTDANGRSRLTLMEKTMNASGEYPVGNYTVEATYDTYSANTSINLTENKQITLELEDFVIPEFPSPIILPLFITATLLIVIAHRRKH